MRFMFGPGCRNDLCAFPCPRFIPEIIVHPEDIILRKEGMIERAGRLRRQPH
jgi:hypothetical protein